MHLDQEGPGMLQPGSAAASSSSTVTSGGVTGGGRNAATGLSVMGPLFPLIATTP
jgi:hypothetical protein